MLPIVMLPPSCVGCPGLRQYSRARATFNHVRCVTETTACLLSMIANYCGGPPPAGGCRGARKRAAASFRRAENVCRIMSPLEFKETSMPLPVSRSGNPGLNDKTFSGLPRLSVGGERMTLQGAINKSFLLLVVLLAGAFWPWSEYLSTGDASVVGPSILIGAVGGLVLGLVISFKATLAPYLAIPYAALEGLAMGGFSALLERRYPGIAIQAVGLTFGVLAVLLVAYSMRLIRVTQRFRSIVIGATGAIALLYLVTMVLGLFHVTVPVLNSSSPLGIIVSLVICGVAALNLVLDFDLIESGVAQGAPRYMEWYSAFGLLVTLVWLYLEILRLLSNVRNGDGK
jgi:uncharacterized YccA/Bax inhibitor family protein